MMVMATGFKQALSKQTDQVYGLKQLANGEIGETMLPPSFNVGYVGPNGPMIYDSNGDLSIGYVTQYAMLIKLTNVFIFYLCRNYLIYNLQQGNAVNIGHSLGGKMQLTQLPIFHDGTTNVRNALNDQHSLMNNFFSDH